MIEFFFYNFRLTVFFFILLVLLYIKIMPGDGDKRNGNIIYVEDKVQCNIYIYKCKI